MGASEFAQGCTKLARIVCPDWDSQGLDDHLAHLLARGDRYAAAMLILPPTWGYQVSRSLRGEIRAAIELPDARGWQDEVCSDEEGAAILGAIAATVGPFPANF